MSQILWSLSLLLYAWIRVSWMFSSEGPLEVVLLLEHALDQDCL